MLPLGHVAAGYLLSEGFLALAQPAVSSNGAHWLLAIGVAASFAPDLDMFLVFKKEGGLIHTGAKGNHRDSLSHVPLAWLALGVAVAAIGQNDFWRTAGDLLVIGSWSHFLLDSTDVGVRWLYPFDKRFFAFKNAGRPEKNSVRGFFPHWFNMLKQYWRRAPVTVIIETALVVSAVWAMVTSR